MSSVVKLFFLLIFPALLSPADFATVDTHTEAKALAAKTHTAICSEQHTAAIALFEKYETQEIEIDESASSTSDALFVPDLTVSKSLYFYYFDISSAPSYTSFLSYLARLSISPPLNS